MVKVRTSKIDEKQPPEKAHKIPRGANGLPRCGDKPVTVKARPYDAERNADDGVDYNMSLADFLGQVEELTKKKRLNGVFIELGDIVVPWYVIRSIVRADRYNDSQQRYEYGIVLNHDTMVAEGDNFAEWWVTPEARDAAWDSLRSQLVELGITIASTKV